MNEEVKVGAAPAPPSTPLPVWHPPRRQRLMIAVIAILAVAAILAILAAWDLPPFGGGAESTENAYVRGRTMVIAQRKAPSHRPQTGAMPCPPRPH
jgi:hypothetical protein